MGEHSLLLQDGQAHKRARKLLMPAFNGAALRGYQSLVSTIARQTGFDGELVWDTSKPNGQPRRKLDTTRAREAFGFTSSIDFATGLRRTVEWYREHRVPDAP